MIHALTLFYLVAVATSVCGLRERGLKVRYDINPFGFGTKSFIELPQSTSEATAKGWERVTRPEGPPGYAALGLWCPTNDYGVCVLFDDTGYVAGLQIALDQSRFNSLYDLPAQGFTNWTAIVNGKAKHFYTIQQYYISPETLATEANTRISSRNPELLLQDGNLYVTGFNGALFNISTTVKDFTVDSIYKKQACVPWMGVHYYYNMSTTTPCQPDTLFPWFPLVYDDQLIGVGFVVFGQYQLNPKYKDYFEHPGKLAAQLIIPRGPECLYKLVESVGIVTMHTYFIKHPQLVSCL